MNSATAHRELFMPQPPGGLGRGLVLALLVHALLLAALAVGVRWRSSNPQGIQAELWAAVPQVAAPRAATPEERPAPTKRRPEPPPPPPPPPPRPAPVERAAPPPPAPRPDPQIAIEQERQKREAARRLELKEQAEREEKARRLKIEEQARAAEKAQREEAERVQQRVREQLAQAQREKERKQAEEQARQKELAAKAEERARQKELAAKAEARRIAEAREAAIRRMTAQAGGSTGEAGSTGTADRTAAPSAGYTGRVIARIKPNIVFVDTLTSNPEAEVLVRLAPDGRIISQKLVRSSGSREWDQAVQRAIERTEMLPRDVDGRVPPSMSITFRPRE